MGKLFRRAIPPFARAAFGGKARLAKRFTSKIAGELWISKINDRIKALKVGGDIASVGVRSTTTFTLASAGWIGQLEIKRSTMTEYARVLKKRINPVLGAVKVSQIGKTLLDQYKSKRRQESNRFGKKTSDRSLKSELDVIFSVIRWAKAANYLVDESAFLVDKPDPIPDKIRKYDPAEVEKFRDAARVGPLPNPKKKARKHPDALAMVAQRDILIIELLSLAGLRVGELRAMRVGWIRWDDRRIVVPHDSEYSPKGGRTRSIPLEDQLAILLRTWIGDRTSGRVIEPQRRGRPRGKGSFRGIGVDVDKIMVRLSESAGFKMTAHDLRHHAISRWCELMTAGGWSLIDIQRWAGHQSIRTTELYMHQVGERWVRHAEAIDRAAGGTVTGSGVPPAVHEIAHDAACRAGLAKVPKQDKNLIGNRSVKRRKK